MENIKIVLELLDIHINYVKNIQKYKKYGKLRLPNFPEFLSENICLYIINKTEKYKYSRENAKTGDLIKEDGKKIEVKSFSSKGPTSFGPSEKWDELYFVDSTNFLESKFKVYKFNIKNDDEDMKKLKINKNQTYFDQCQEKRRPRINFKYFNTIK
jgi:hypothetical protein